MVVLRVGFHLGQINPPSLAPGQGCSWVPSGTCGTSCLRAGLFCNHFEFDAVACLHFHSELWISAFFGWLMLDSFETNHYQGMNPKKETFFKTFQ